MAKILIVISSLITLVIAVEAGYLWGIKRSASFTPGTNIIRQPALSPTPYPTPFPTSMIPSLLSYQAAVAVGQNTTNSGIWQSDWIIGFSGNLVSLLKDAVSIDSYDGEKKIISFPAGVEVTYSQWSNSQKASSLLNSAGFKPGDNIGVNFTIETTSGNFKRLEIIKNVD